MYQKQTPETIQEMFATISENYDRANTLFSFGLHKIWNRILVKYLRVEPKGELLDLCAGTGEIAFHFLRRYPQAHATLLDFCPQMLSVAQKKGTHSSHRFQCVQGDAQSLPFPSDSFAAATIAYGIRNVKEPKLCFQETFRVLKKGGSFGILELTRPSNPLLRSLHALHLKYLLPLLGTLAAKNSAAYQYLGNSIQSFPAALTLKQELEEVGFSHVKIHPLFGGIATVITALKGHSL